MPDATQLPVIWGIVNVTPDSFSDGGRYADTETAVAHGLVLAADGADVLDIGGESTRPGATPVSIDEEIARVVPVIEGLAAELPEATISIDTRHAAVAEAALDAGATIVNDVSAGSDPAMFALAARHDVDLVLMHMLGQPQTMQADPRYDDVVAEVAGYLQARREAAMAAGVRDERIWIDPGIGFGKTLDHNLALLRDLEALVRLGAPVLLGASRKTFLGRLTERPEPSERLAGSLACALRALEAGVRAVRVHDVRETREILEVFTRIR
ncbi:MAG: dihydropteroate synthase [Planctomycetota bacterium]|nr:dihydropteroate synthase [Planctomycetota bacterium]